MQGDPVLLIEGSVRHRRAALPLRQGLSETLLDLLDFVSIRDQRSVFSLLMKAKKATPRSLGARLSLHEGVPLGAVKERAHIERASLGVGQDFVKIAHVV